MNLLAQEPLNDLEKREILVRLQELGIQREKVASLEAYIDREQDVDARERELVARGMELKQKEIELAHQETELWKQKAGAFEHAFKVATAGRSGRCKVLKIFTLGIARCH